MSIEPLNSPLLDLVAKVPPAHDGVRAGSALEDLAAAAEKLEDGKDSATISALIADRTGAALLRGIFGNSPFLTRTVLREVAWLPALIAAVPEQTAADLLLALEHDLIEAGDMAQAMRALREARRRTALLVAVADLGGIWPLEQVTDTLSRFADRAVAGAVRFLLRRLVARGEFESDNPEEPDHDSGLAVIAMGKLGANELNYSSDIDVMVFFDSDKARYLGRKTAQEAYIRLVRDLVQLLQEPTADGFVLRTDLRLRPDPGATPVAISMTAAEHYYESMGQNWERAAMIKARAMAGDIEAGRAFLERLSPFIWRRNLDFASIEDVHSIKRQIHGHRGHSEIAVAGHNIKLGRGGIRDIEFFVQTQQLIAGGRDASIRGSTTCGAMQALAEAGWLDDQVVVELTRAYDFHRTLEHRLQMIADEQTQTMPKTADGVDHIARFMGYEDTSEFEDRLLHELGTVQRHYANLFEAAPGLGKEGNLVFTGSDEDPETLETLTAMGFVDAAQVSKTVRGWHHGRYRATRAQRSRERLTTLMPVLLAVIGENPDGDATLARFDRFLSGLPAGIQLFAMLTAAPQLLDLLIEILASAPRLANHLSRNPGVLDAVLSEDFFASLPPADELAASLGGGLHLASDIEDALDITRRWVKDRRFQLGVQCLQGGADVDTQGFEQSLVAETALAALLDKVTDDFAVRERHGVIAEAGMAVVGMGKLGSNEMTETSDLDLIFIYDFPDGADQSDGERPLSTSHYFTRLSQRLINAITAQTAEGALYEVDMRLRPSGNAGPVATRIAGFVSYQDTEAWTWEHMALTRARVIAGPAELRRRVEEAIAKVLTRPRDTAKIAADVADMRDRIAKEKGSDNPWELKMVRGGLLDIEFIAQYLQLVNGEKYPGAIDPNTCTALAQLAADGALSPELAEELITASAFYRGVMGILRVAVEGDFDPDKAPTGLQEALVHAAEGETPFEGLEQRLRETQARVQVLYDQVIGAAEKPT